MRLPHESLLVTTKKQKDFIMTVMPDFKSITHVKLLYRGSRDGWKQEDFHRLCDNQGPTLTLVKSSVGRVSGGFTTVSWTSHAGWGADAKALVFSVDSEVMFPCITHALAVYHYSTYGP